MTSEIERNANLAYAAVAAYRHDPCEYCTPGDAICDELWDILTEVKFDGFTTLGAGGSRVALLRDGLVYKVEYTLAMGYTYFMERSIKAVNLTEFENYIKFHDMELPRGWRFPVTDIVWIADHAVLVTEYIDAVSDWSYEGSPEHREVIKATGLNDIWCENVLFDGSNWYLVDFAQ